MCVYMSTHMYVSCVQSPTEARKEHQVPCGWDTSIYLSAVTMGTEKQT